MGPSLRKLDVSHNSLKRLPMSFRRLTRHMKFLEIFRAGHNHLEALPSDVLSDAASITASGGSSSSRSPPLRILALSHNQLVSVPSLVGLDHLEVLELHSNALVGMTVADWSQLALRLSSLRILTNDSQRHAEA